MELIKKHFRIRIELKFHCHFRVRIRNVYYTILFNIPIMENVVTIVTTFKSLTIFFFSTFSSH